MKYLFGIAMIAGVVVGGWILATTLSRDALGLLLGLVVGIFSVLPGLFVTVADRRRRDEAELAAPPTVVFVERKPWAELPVVVVEACAKEEGEGLQPSPGASHNYSPEGRKSHDRTEYLTTRAGARPR